MPLDHPTATQLTQVISQVTAPAFLIGAVAAFVSVLMGRMNRVIDRLQGLDAIGDDDKLSAHQRADTSQLRRRAALLNRAIVFATISAIVTSLLVIVAFLSAYLQLQHEYGVGAFFIVALIFFTAALVDLAREARISLHEIDQRSHHEIT